MTFYGPYDRHLSADERASVAKARDFCTGRFSSEAHAAYRAGQAIPETWFAKWAETGLLGLQAKTEHGGLGASFMCKIRVAQEVARHSFAMAFCVNHHQGSVTRLSKTGSERQQQELLGEMLKGRILATIAMTEPQGGSDAAAMVTAARPVDGGWLINGTKSWLTNGMMVNGLLLLARVEGAASPDPIASFFVSLDDGKTITRRELAMAGARSFRFAEIEFKDHFVPGWALFAKPGEAFKSSMSGINAARVHVAAMCVASLESALQEAVSYCEKRHAFGKPLLSHQGLRWELAEVATRLEAASALVCRAALEVDGNSLSMTTAAQCKKFAVDTSIWGIDQCIRAMGAIGASDTHRLAMLHAEVRMSAYGDGTNEILLDRIGRSLVKDYGAASPAKAGQGEL